ncbi:DUF192 domain-containing protein [Candidatus Methylomicrobium oryzae]|jgi:uncharacterized membrane protein (UPF0127 family)|uniref:DUF192 domain-containing protein n=1 Tax=Candidatus Methylomicrobium oryzae TaxID=2802053 RepID=UPI001920C38B|nr:DUF192 domain-containing protein [Methylomicrobium sp. RS1]MBL1264055.1 DUF192 domain-containing protein [Methylomicrobium sp. RS1]
MDRLLRARDGRISIKRLFGVASMAIISLVVTGWAFLVFSPEFKERTLNIGFSRLQVEVADNETTRTRGMMFRLVPNPSQGMLFVFPTVQPVCMWMKYTLVPLSVAFIRDNGSIANIADMNPLQLERHCAREPVRFALEVSQGWFAATTVDTRTQITGLPRF